jgi:hypothetical protein
VIECHGSANWENDDLRAIFTSFIKQIGPENISISGPNLLSTPENDLRQTKIMGLTAGSAMPNRHAGLGMTICLLSYRLNAHNLAFAKLDCD